MTNFKIVLVLLLFFVCVILYIILTSNNNDSGVFYSECNFESSKESDGTPKTIRVSNLGKQIIFDEVNIKSIKSKGYKLFLYEEIDFEGEPLIIDIKTEYINECFENPIKSIKIFKQ
jgi:hypothetical protein